MLSDKLYNILDCSTKVCYKIGGSFLLFDKEKKHLFFPNDIKHQNHVIRNFILLAIWLVICFILTINVYIFGDQDKFQINLVYCIGGLTMSPTCALPICYPHQVCIALNGCLSFLQLFNGKLVEIETFCLNIKHI